MWKMESWNGILYHRFWLADAQRVPNSVAVTEGKRGIPKGMMNARRRRKGDEGRGLERRIRQPPHRGQCDWEANEGTKRAGRHR